MKGVPLNCVDTIRRPSLTGCGGCGMVRLHGVPRDKGDRVELVLQRMRLVEGGIGGAILRAVVISWIGSKPALTDKAVFSLTGGRVWRTPGGHSTIMPFEGGRTAEFLRQATRNRGLRAPDGGSRVFAGLQR